VALVFHLWKWQRDIGIRPLSTELWPTRIATSDATAEKGGTAVRNNLACYPEDLTEILQMNPEPA
jgi:hypothetical protein